MSATIDITQWDSAMNEIWSSEELGVTLRKVLGDGPLNNAHFMKYFACLVLDGVEKRIADLKMDDDVHDDVVRFIVNHAQPALKQSLSTLPCVDSSSAGYCIMTARRAADMVVDLFWTKHFGQFDSSKDHPSSSVTGKKRKIFKTFMNEPMRKLQKRWKQHFRSSPHAEVPNVDSATSYTAPPPRSPPQQNFASQTAPSPDQPIPGMEYQSQQQAPLQQECFEKRFARGVPFSTTQPSVTTAEQEMPSPPPQVDSPQQEWEQPTPVDSTTSKPHEPYIQRNDSGVELGMSDEKHNEPQSLDEMLQIEQERGSANRPQPAPTPDALSVPMDGVDGAGNGPYEPARPDDLEDYEDEDLEPYWVAAACGKAFFCRLAANKAKALAKIKRSKGTPMALQAQTPRTSHKSSKADAKSSKAAKKEQASRFDCVSKKYDRYKKHFAKDGVGHVRPTLDPIILLLLQETVGNLADTQDMAAIWRASSRIVNMPTSTGFNFNDNDPSSVSSPGANVSTDPADQEMRTDPPARNHMDVDAAEFDVEADADLKSGGSDSEDYEGDEYGPPPSSTSPPASDSDFPDSGPTTSTARNQSGMDQSSSAAHDTGANAHTHHSNTDVDDAHPVHINGNTPEKHRHCGCRRHVASVWRNPCLARDMRHGWIPILTRSHWLRCGFHSIIGSIRAQYPRMRWPTIDELELVLENLPLLNCENNFGLSELTSILQEWCKLFSVGVTLQLAAIQRTHKDGEYIILYEGLEDEAKNVQPLWIYNDNAEELTVSSEANLKKGGKEIYNHWSAMEAPQSNVEWRSFWASVEAEDRMAPAPKVVDSVVEKAADVDIKDELIDPVNSAAPSRPSTSSSTHSSIFSLIGQPETPKTSVENLGNELDAGEDGFGRPPSSAQRSKKKKKEKTKEKKDSNWRARYNKVRDRKDDAELSCILDGVSLDLDATGEKKTKSADILSVAMEKLEVGGKTRKKRGKGNNVFTKVKDACNNTMEKGKQAWEEGKKAIKKVSKK